jgi:hypothetical protein
VRPPNRPFSRSLTIDCPQKGDYLGEDTFVDRCAALAASARKRAEVVSRPTSRPEIYGSHRRNPFLPVSGMHLYSLPGLKGPLSNR